MKKKVVLAFSGGLDTSFCVKYLSEEQGYDVYTAIANTGGFSPEELTKIEQRAIELGAVEHATLNIEQEYYEKSIRYMVYGNILRNGTYPISVSSERIFQAIAIITTSGYSTTDIGTWSHVAQFVILILMCMGAMSGSTSGGIKIGRHIIFFKSAYNELQRDVHPNAILPVMYNGKALPAATISNLFGFLVFYILLVALSVGIFYTMGLNMEESLSVSLSSLGNVGPALGSFTSHYALMPAFGKWWMCFLMLVGRLEIYTILLLLSRSFWNKA